MRRLLLIHMAISSVNGEKRLQMNNAVMAAATQVNAGRNRRYGRFDILRTVGDLDAIVRSVEIH